MNKQWSTVYIVIATLSAAFTSGCVTDVNGPESETGAEEGQLGQVQQAITTSSSSSGGGPTLPPPDCDGKGVCYCFCRLEHPCWKDSSQCSALSQCLTSCDYQYPSYCPAPGSSYPNTAADCL